MADSETDRAQASDDLALSHEQKSIMAAFEQWERATANHHAGTFSTEVLKRLEHYLPTTAGASAETGCGKSTILFSNVSKNHKVFALDDRHLGENSSANYFLSCPLSVLPHIETVWGPTQKTLPTYSNHASYDFVMIDGPHGYPFPELEYYFFYPHICPGGLLIVDDLNIPTIGRLADFLVEDDMFEICDILQTTGIFRRTDSPVFDPYGDGWWEQKYNRRRVSEKRDIFLNDRAPLVDEITARYLDRC